MTDRDYEAQVLRHHIAELEAELAARREVDEWLRAALARSLWIKPDGAIVAEHVLGPIVETDADAPDYQSLAAALRGVK